MKTIPGSSVFGNRARWGYGSGIFKADAGFRSLRRIEDFRFLITSLFFIISFFFRCVYEEKYFTYMNEGNELQQKQKCLFLKLHNNTVGTTSVFLLKWNFHCNVQQSFLITSPNNDRVRAAFGSSGSGLWDRFLAGHNYVLVTLRLLAKRFLKGQKG